MKSENIHPDDAPENSRKLFIGGLSRDTTDESLTNFYQQWGETADVIVMKDPVTKKSRGFGFVTYKTSASVDDAMGNRPHVIDGKTVDPKRAVPREEGQKGEHNISSKRLYLSNIKDDLTEDMIKEYFSKFGSVEKVDVIMDKVTNKPRGFGFVTFDDYDPVDKCIIQKVHTIGDFRCEAKKALNKEDMVRAQQNRERLDRSGRSRGMGRDAGPGRGSYGGSYSGGGGGYDGGYGGGYQQGGNASYGGGYGGGYTGYSQQPQQGGWGDQAWGQGNAAGAWGQSATAGGVAAASGQWGQGAPAGSWGAPVAGGPPASSWGQGPAKY